jgi:hypothetical protein
MPMTFLNFLIHPLNEERQKGAVYYPKHTRRAQQGESSAGAHNSQIFAQTARFADWSSVCLH